MFMEALAMNPHCSKHFKCINSLNNHSPIMKVLAHFTDEEIQQFVQVCTTSNWQSCDLNVSGLAAGPSPNYNLQHNAIRNYSVSRKQISSIWKQDRALGNENMIIIIKTTIEDSKDNFKKSLRKLNKKKKDKLKDNKIRDSGCKIHCVTDRSS